MKIRTLLLLLALTLTQTSCASWITQFKANPVATLQEDISYIVTALNLARGAFDLLATTSPQIEASRPQFETIVTDVNQGLLVAQDSLRVAATAQGPAPDPNALLHDAQTAMGHLHDFINSLSQGMPGRSASPLVLRALHATQVAAQPLAR